MFVLKMGQVKMSSEETFGVESIEEVTFECDYADMDDAEDFIRASKKKYEHVGDNWYFPKKTVDSREKGKLTESISIAIWIEEE